MSTSVELCCRLNPGILLSLRGNNGDRQQETERKGAQAGVGGGGASGGVPRGGGTGTASRGGEVGAAAEGSSGGGSVTATLIVGIESERMPARVSGADSFVFPDGSNGTFRVTARNLSVTIWSDKDSLSLL